MPDDAQCENLFDGLLCREKKDLQRRGHNGALRDGWMQF
jgi:hypothetical protein